MARGVRLAGAVTVQVVGHAATCGAAWLVERLFEVRLGLEVTPHELAGAALGLLLVLPTNAECDRWWEASKLWRGFVDRSRNFVSGATAYGPSDPAWRERPVRWAAACPHVVRHSLRGERPGPCGGQPPRHRRRRPRRGGGAHAVVVLSW